MYIPLKWLRIHSSGFSMNAQKDGLDRHQGNATNVQKEAITKVTITQALIHNVAYKIQKIQLFPPSKHYTPTIQDFYKLKPKI